MAGGLEIAGLFYFGAVKFAGYSLAARFLRSRYAGNNSNSFLVGGARTAIGFAAGLGAVAIASAMHIGVPSPAWYVLLLPIRLLEWLAVIWFFYERPVWEPSAGRRWARMLGWSTLGIAWSALLDIPAVTAVFVLPGGAWIC